MTTLMNERLAAGQAMRPGVRELITLCRNITIEGRPAIENHAVRERIAAWHVLTQAVTYTRFRSMTALSKGHAPGPENAIIKLVNASKLLDLSSFGIDLLGPAGVVTHPALATLQTLFQDALLAAPGSRIAAGTDEILRNVIAERVLGLPAEIRVDRDKPFKDIPQGRC
jgi:alkylation response protein AidB-like acyl-CoA dehydrogenase